MTTYPKLKLKWGIKIGCAWYNHFLGVFFIVIVIVCVITVILNVYSDLSSVFISNKFINKFINYWLIDLLIINWFINYNLFPIHLKKILRFIFYFLSVLKISNLQSHCLLRSCPLVCPPLNRKTSCRSMQFRHEKWCQQRRHCTYSRMNSW